MRGRGLRAIAVSSTLVVILQLCITEARCEIYGHSRFRDAREPLSQLDYKLLTLEERWNDAFAEDPDPDAYDHDDYALIARAGIRLLILYNDLADVIEISALVSDWPGFAAMSEAERQQLLVDIVNALPRWYGSMVIIKEGRSTYEPVPSARHFRVALDVGLPAPGTERHFADTVPLPWRDGSEMSGQAGYAEGRFAYSTGSYLLVSLSSSGWRPAPGEAEYLVREQ
jgi:hypothetical protein